MTTRVFDAEISAFKLYILLEDFESLTRYKVIVVKKHRWDVYSSLQMFTLRLLYRKMYEHVEFDTVI